jgi:hypothetical protein
MGSTPQCSYSTLASMPGDDLLFQRLSVSTIGADWFHGRVREGIGWVTDAMVTKQWSRRTICVGVGFRSMILSEGMGLAVKNDPPSWHLQGVQS